MDSTVAKHCWAPMVPGSNSQAKLAPAANGEVHHGLQTVPCVSSPRQQPCGSSVRIPQNLWPPVTLWPSRHYPHVGYVHRKQKWLKRRQKLTFFILFYLHQVGSKEHKKGINVIRYHRCTTTHLIGFSNLLRFQTISLSRTSLK